MEQSHAGTRWVTVWDLPIRLFHWLTVLLMIALYVTWRANWMDWHALAGETLLALVIFRVLWGFVGSDTARFNRFLRSPREALHHLTHFARCGPDHQVGHNAAGGWMVLLMIVLITLQILSGLYVQNEVANEGALSERVSPAVSNAISALHGWLWDALLMVITLHIAAIVLYALVKRHDLVRPMLGGVKSLPESVAPPRIASSALAALLLMVSMGAAWMLTTLI